MTGPIPYTHFLMRRKIRSSADAVPHLMQKFSILLKS
jgi:hypothetical protein